MSPLAQHQDLLEQARLCFQTCAACGHAWLPPSTHCPCCLVENWDWRQARGRGDLVSFVVYHRAYHESFAAELPYAVGIVALEEGPRMICRLQDSAEGRDLEQSFRVGQALNLNWTKRNGATVPVFVPMSTMEE